MSNYSAFFAQDFASRCRDLLDRFYKPAKAGDREVTLLLAVAAAGLVVPLERLMPSSRQPRLDREPGQSASRQLQALLGESIADSNLIDTSSCAWQGGLLASADGRPDEWPEIRTGETLPETTRVLDLVYWMRHGLAHGNITTRVGSNRHIARIIFVCGYHGSERQPLRYVSVTPDNLNQFLSKWFDCLAGLDVSREVLAELLNAYEAA